MGCCSACSSLCCGGQRCRVAWAYLLLTLLALACGGRWGSLPEALGLGSCSVRREARGGAPAPGGNATRLRVLVAGQGHTGTHSVAAALGQLGLRSYHSDDKLLLAPGLYGRELSARAFAAAAAWRGLEAVTLEPFSRHLSVALAANPEARVLLLWRDFPSWSFSAFVQVQKSAFWGLLTYLLSSSTFVLPWLQLWDALTGQCSAFFEAGEPYSNQNITLSQMLIWATFYNNELGRVEDKEWDTTRVEFLGGEEAYLADIDEVRRIVPPGRLLELDLRRHGWAELAGFLGLAAPAAGPLPRLNGVHSFSGLSVVDIRPDLYLACCGVLLALHAANLALLCALLGAPRGRRPAAP